MQALLIGYGEVGKAVHHAWGGHHQFFIHDPYKGMSLPDPLPAFDVMLVTIPFSEDFIDIVKGYQASFEPQATVILSTVPIGTSRNCQAVHSPIEALHRSGKMDEYLKVHPRWIGGINEVVVRFFNECNLRVKVCRKPDHTEFMKLASLAQYGIAIEFARYTGLMCGKMGLDHAAIREYDQDYNNLNTKMGVPGYQRSILTPPEGVIGGHCVLQNIEILSEQAMHPFLTSILSINDFLKQGGELKE